MDDLPLKRGLLAAAAVLALCACKTVPINPNDASPPIAEMLVKMPNGQYEVATTASLSGNFPLKLLCRIRDDQGVKSVRLSFQGATSDNCTVNSTPFNGAFPLKPPLPSPIQDVSSGSNGQALKVLPLFHDLPQVTCTVSGQAQPGHPFGHEIIATCEGGNWSSNPANQSSSAQLTITVN